MFSSNYAALITKGWKWSKAHTKTRKIPEVRVQLSLLCPYYLPYLSRFCLGLCSSNILGHITVGFKLPNCCHIRLDFFESLALCITLISKHKENRGNPWIGGDFSSLNMKGTYHKTSARGCLAGQCLVVHDVVSISPVVSSNLKSTTDQHEHTSTIPRNNELLPISTED